MDEIIGSIISLIADAVKKNRERQAAATARMRAGLGSGPQRMPQPSQSPAPPPPMGVQIRPGRAPVRLAEAPETAAQAERRLVEELFASPRSLAAAFIAAEILQPPVALRPHQSAPWNRT